MATENKYFSTTITAGEDLNTSGHRYHAIALDDGKLANNAEEASGILINKPKSGEFLTLGYGGEMTFAAGAAITAGDKLTVTTSGWFTAAGSSSVVIGECKANVTSGSLGTGIFYFPAGTGRTPENIVISLAAKDAILLGMGVDIKTMAVAGNGRDVQAIAQEAVSSGATVQLLLQGKGTGRMSNTTSVGDNFFCTTSGYLNPAPVSGSIISGFALANIASGQTGNIYFYGGQAGYKCDSWAA